MGVSASKRVKNSLANSRSFDSACDSAYAHCLSLTQHAFEGVLPYQLLAASAHLHHTLFTLRLPLVIKWVPFPPTRAQVDSALRAVTRKRHENDGKSSVSCPEDEGALVLGPALFKEWALVVFAEAIVGNATKAVLTRVPIGIAGIAGIGAIARPGKDLIGAAIGIYALGVATSIYVSLSG
ncbi:uncharacterized protein LOC110811021 [Carica papaya]|uniref:uncharacterized protein LOC110811021 n=1 Tax=Carica papaya TaxID=3649 RepID=UPI000B8CC834|nr:uncharacterized protein LOC110811021 [Carica papaya]